VFEFAEFSVAPKRLLMGPNVCPDVRKPETPELRKKKSAQVPWSGETAYCRCQLYVSAGAVLFS
jgi:hypothetical protein